MPNVVGSQLHEMFLIENSPKRTVRILLRVTEAEQILSVNAIVHAHLSLMNSTCWPVQGEKPKVPRFRDKQFSESTSPKRWRARFLMECIEVHAVKSKEASEAVDP